MYIRICTKIIPLLKTAWEIGFPIYIRILTSAYQWTLSNSKDRDMLKDWRYAMGYYLKMTNTDKKGNLEDN